MMPGEEGWHFHGVAGNPHRLGKMTCKDCCMQFGLTVLRGINILVGLVGAGFVGYGAYLDIEIGGSSISGWAGGMIAVGAVIMVLALGLVLCGHKRTWFLRLYLAVFGLMLVFEVLLTCYFLIPSTREKLVDDINPPADIKSEVESHLKLGGYLVVVFMLLQAISMVLAALYRSIMLADRYKAQEDEEAAQYRNLDTTRGKRYREKHADLYEKYNIRRDNV